MLLGQSKFLTELQYSTN